MATLEEGMDGVSLRRPTVSPDQKEHGVRDIPKDHMLLDAAGQ